jgi:SsrA-binding protein
MGDRVVATNRKAFHDYHVGERLEAGLVLTGSEVKSLRQGQASLAEAYAAPEGGEIYLHNLHIPPYDPASHRNHDPRRKRKLLLHRREIRKLEGFVTRKGQTLVPLELRFRGGYAKLVLALATGKKAHDKRRALAEREAEREVSRALSRRSRDRGA